MLGVVYVGQPCDRDGRVGAIRVSGLFPDGQRAPIIRRRCRIHIFIVMQRRKIIQAQRGLYLLAGNLFPDRQRFLVERFGLGEQRLVLVKDRQVVHAGGHLRVVRAQLSCLHLDGLFIELFRNGVFASLAGGCGRGQVLVPIRLFGRRIKTGNQENQDADDNRC